LHPDFLSYRYIPWEEGYAFAHLEILEVKGGYNKGDGKYSSYVVKCRVVADAWNVLEEGSDLNLVCTYREAEFFETISSVLLRFEVRGTFAYTNKDGETGYGMLLDQAFNYLGCFPLEDGKVKLNIMEEYLKTNNLKLNYVGNHKISSDPDYVYCTFEDVASIVGEGMAVETAVENLRDVYEKYQTGEYNHNFSVDLISKMNYGEYIRLTKQESTPEDFKKFGTEIKLAYLVFPREESRDIILSDGTVYPFLTVMKLPEDAWEMLMKEVAEFEQACTDENGVLNAEACIQKIKQREGTYNVWSVLGGYELR
ncbi:MAG: hypothetical protein IJX19_13195, partial [Clostridia bacterium]|nr:hypothetical protein [Clostridia bacterium]